MTTANANATARQAKHIVVYGRRWFQKLYGNTYHSVKVCVDGELLGYVPFEYGYGDQYLQTAMELLVKAGLYEGKNEHGYTRVLWRAAQDAGDTLVYSVQDVTRRKDLAQ